MGFLALFDTFSYFFPFEGGGHGEGGLLGWQFCLQEIRIKIFNKLYILKQQLQSHCTLEKVWNEGMNQNLAYETVWNQGYQVL